MGDRVLVLPDNKGESTTKSGIIVAGASENLTGIVAAVGPGRVDHGELVPINIKRGERVLIGKYGYDELTFDGKQYLLVPEGSILAVIV